MERSFIEYHLKKVGIELWDSQMRIVQFRLNNPNYLNQLGGGFKNILIGNDFYQIKNLVTLLLK